MNCFKSLIITLCCFVVCAGPFFPDPQGSAASPPEKSDGAKPGEKKTGTGSLEGPSVLKNQKTSPTGPVYRPPLRGSPGGRVGGGTRGLPLKSAVSLYALAPDHVGLTVHEEPNLYWYISAVPTSQVEFALIENDSTFPLIKERIKPPGKAGIQCIRLADYAVRLRENTRYKWFITLLAGTDQRSGSVVSGGFIERTPVPGDLPGKLQKADKRREHYVYAEEGIWYDALTALSELIVKAPRDMTLRRERASLLEQAGLEEVAAYDLK